MFWENSFLCDITSHLVRVLKPVSAAAISQWARLIALVEHFRIHAQRQQDFRPPSKRALFDLLKMRVEFFLASLHVDLPR